MKKLISATLLVASMMISNQANAQSELYPQHFDLSEVTLLDGPFKTAMETNDNLLLKYDVDRLMTPFIRQAGLSDNSSSKYYGWVSKHPSFSNWGLWSWSLEGHVGGHYLTALSLAYAASHDSSMKAKMKERLEYVVNIMKDCQDAYDDNTEGLYGFIGGQPINRIWTGLYANDLTEFKKYGGWVPFYCEHKILAGLRDAWIYAGNETAKECFRKLADWSVNVVSKLSYNDMQTVLGWEHGGMNESMVDAYQIFGEKKYLNAAKKYSHAYERDGMQGTVGNYSTTFLDGQHANTQVPKFIGFQRIAEQETTASTYKIAARNFWDDVANNRTVCIGGNSVEEHFLSAGNSANYINKADGPESCNTNNMLKLSEMMFDYTHNAKYADFYEYAMWNHILATQDPKTGGYVYFTTLRPQGYKIYSQVNQGMWCCVGTGMENHSKYGHFIYTHDGSTLYVNLFSASKLESDSYSITQETEYPYEQQTKLTVGTAGTYTIAIRHPWWTTDDYAISVNGEKQSLSVTAGEASYASISRTWKKGDVIVVNLPMTMRVAECPNYTDYVAFEYGPILLSAPTTAASENDGSGLAYEALQNEYGGEGRMDHAPGVVGKSLALSTAPMLLGERSEVLNKIKEDDLSKLTFTIDAHNESRGTAEKWNTLTLKPFYTVHHTRYMCYWYQQTEEVYKQSDMAKSDSIEAALNDRTIDFVGTGEQQSEAGHDASYGSTSTSGSYNGEYYRDAQANDYIQYNLYNPNLYKDNLSILCRFTTADAGRKATLYVDGVAIADIDIPSTYATAVNGFYNIEYPLPESVAVDENGNAKSKFTVRLVASSSTVCPGLYYLRLMKGYVSDAYVFVASEWSTGDTNRLKKSNISYDTENNTISIKNTTGTNNICLTLDYANTNYTIGDDDIYLVVRGTNLLRTSGASYLWWLNGKNRASSVAPTMTTTDYEGNSVIVWDMSTSGIDDFIDGDRPNITYGATIFGMTTSTGKTVIKDINFCSNVDEYLQQVTSIKDISDSNATAGKKGIYNLQGIRLDSGDTKDINHLSKGVYIVDGEKHVIN